MSLSPGSRIGAYEILDLLGAGGMGEVYRARDTRLDRTVAIKILQGHLTADADLRHRFEREAKIVSSLNHPHICTLYDVGHHDGIEYIVMEHLEGESLAERLTRGPLPLPELLKVATEIADALDRAHRQGLVHRDLKPGNIMLTKGGAKLLDFGLARATGLSPNAGDLSSPTLSRPITTQGTIVGTFQYMAPEQLEGKDADARSDIFSFGAVLYEMATGRRAFEGKSQASLIASILKETPRPISSVDALSPPALDRAVMRCLEKEPDDRWQTSRDLLLELKWVAEAGSRAGVAAPVAARRKSRERMAWGIAGVGAVAAIALGAWAIANRPAKPEAIRFFIQTPGAIRTIGTPKISPDGRFLAYNATDSSGVARIWLRPMGSLVAQPLPGTESAQRPFWSPDSRFIAFMADNRLKKIAVTGGPPQTICDTGTNGDGSWGSGGVILFDGSPTDSVRRVSASGGQSSAATLINRTEEEFGTAWPQFLPDGRHFLYLGLVQRQGQTTLKVGDLKSTKTKTLLKGNLSRIEYVAPGYVLFVRDRALYAQPFDTGKLELTGEPFPVVDDVAAGGGVASNADFSASSNGVLVFQGGVSGRQSKLAWVDRAGRILTEIGGVADYYSLSLSSDERRVVVDAGPGNPDLWILEVSRGVTGRFTFETASDFAPIWSPDGSRVAFASDRSGPGAIYVKPATGAQSESLLASHTSEMDPADWSRDGRFIAAVAAHPSRRWDVWIVPLEAGQKPYPFLTGPFSETSPRFSPDGRWLAYTSSESGRREVYVQPVPGPGGKWQVSSQGGGDPVWRRDGGELYFIAINGSMMAVDVTLGTTLELGTPRTLFTGVAFETLPTGHNYAVSADGQRFLIRKPLQASELPATTVFVNWTAGFEKR